MSKPKEKLTAAELAELDELAGFSNSPMTEEIAVKHFGYRWFSWTGRPVKGTPGYPNKMRVRQLLSPDQMKLQGWKKALADPDTQPATGEEPLDYTYCSSGCSVAMLPSRSELATKLAKRVPRLIDELRELRDEVERLRDVKTIRERLLDFEHRAIGIAFANEAFPVLEYTKKAEEKDGARIMLAYALLRLITEDDKLEADLAAARKGRGS